MRRSKHPARARSSIGSKCWAAISIAYLNLDKVIKIIRNEDEPKPVLMKTLQAHRRAGRRHPQHAAAQPAQARGDGDQARGQGPARGEGRRSRSCSAPRRSSGRRSPTRSRRCARRSARRRRSASAAPTSPRRPSTTRRRSKRRWSSASRSPSWCRRRAGSARCAATSADLSGVAFKADDALKFAFPAETTSKILVFATNGRFYTLDAAKLPGGRGHGEPVRLFIDMEQDARPGLGVPLSGRPQVPGRERDRAAASSWPRTNASPTPARASRCSTSSRRTRRARSRRSRASWSPRSARTARW